LPQLYGKGVQLKAARLPALYLHALAKCGDRGRVEVEATGYGGCLRRLTEMEAKLALYVREDSTP